MLILIKTLKIKATSTAGLTENQPNVLPLHLLPLLMALPLLLLFLLFLLYLPLLLLPLLVI